MLLFLVQYIGLLMNCSRLPKSGEKEDPPPHMVMRHIRRQWTVSINGLQ